MATQTPDVMYQQGDVLARSVRAVPKGAQPVRATPRGYVLAEGEATGHAHVVAGDALECYEKDGVLYLRVGEGGATVSHEEHAAQTWAPGVYEIDRVREFDYLAQLARRVAD